MPPCSLRLLFPFALLLSPDGKVIVPACLSEREKRFFIRFLIADGEGVMILEDDGTLRKPIHVGEIQTPPDSPPIKAAASAAAAAATPTASSAGNKRQRTSSKKVRLHRRC
jgi:hypothetical protein